MNRITPLLLFSLVFLLLSGVCHAHRVNVFAYVDGEVLRVEASFSKSQKVVNGQLRITDRETGDPVHEGTTDEQGRYSFRPSQAFLATGHGLLITLRAGEGHQNTWEITPEELQALSAQGATGEATGGGAVARGHEPAAGTLPSAEALSPAEPTPHPAPSMVTMPKDELETLIGKVLDAKLAPIKQSLARQETSGPGVQDIIGGIGWILGLVGIAAYMKSRK